MISVVRGKAPSALTAKALEKEIESLKRIYGPERRLYPRGQKWPAVDDENAYKLYNRKDVKAALIRNFLGKCAYCEMLLPKAKETNVEHYRPKGRVDVEGGARWFPGYFEHAARWENLLPACGTCNSAYKQNKFPIKNEKHRFTRFERPLFLHPCKDTPERHLRFGVENLEAYVVGATERGKATVDGLGLMKDEDLVAHRTATLRRFCQRWCEYETELRKAEAATRKRTSKPRAGSVAEVEAAIAKMLHSRNPHAGMLRQMAVFFQELIDRRKSVAEWYAQELKVEEAQDAEDKRSLKDWLAIARSRSTKPRDTA